MCFAHMWIIYDDSINFYKFSGWWFFAFIFISHDSMWVMISATFSVKRIVYGNRINLDKIKYRFVFAHFVYDFLLFFTLWTHNPNKCLQYKALFNVTNVHTSTNTHTRTLKEQRIGNVRIEFYLFFSPSFPFQIILSFTLCSELRIGFKRTLNNGYIFFCFVVSLIEQNNNSRSNINMKKKTELE